MAKSLPKSLGRIVYGDHNYNARGGHYERRHHSTYNLGDYYERRPTQNRVYDQDVRNQRDTQRRFTDNSRPPQHGGEKRRNRSPSSTTYQRWYQLPEEDVQLLPKRPRIDNEIIPNSVANFIDTNCDLDFLFHRIKFHGSFSEFRRQSNFPETFDGCIATFSKPSTADMRDSSTWEKIFGDPRIWVVFGCHSQNAHNFDDNMENNLKDALTNPKVIGVGEIGLDYSPQNDVNPLIQRRVFRDQLNIAARRKLPIVVDSRNATEETISIMKRNLPNDYKIHRKCFTGTWQEAQIWLNAFPNLCLGFTNVVNYPSSKDVQDVARFVPVDRFLLETDSPSFGRKEDEYSNPGMALDVAIEIAKLKKMELGHVLLHARANTRQMYNI